MRSRSWIVAMLLFLAMPVMAEEEELCAPFREGVVDESLVSIMLDAAEEGHLYRIHKDSSRVGFCVDSEFAEVAGEFKEVTGGLAFGTEDDNNGQTMVVVQANSLETNHAIIEPLIKGERFFDVRNYPEILFVSTRFAWINADSAVLLGNLTLHGVTRPVTFHVKLTNLGQGEAGLTDRVLFTATTAINRSEFDMDTLSSLVSDEVRLCLSVEAFRYRN